MTGIDDVMEKISKNIINVANTHTENGGNKCPICHGSGWEEIVTSDGKEGVRECACGILRKRIMENRLAFANIPEEFKDVRLSNFNVKVYSKESEDGYIRVLMGAVNYWLFHVEGMIKSGMGLYFHSRTRGSGKTRLAISIANELIYSKGIQVKFTTFLQILNEIKATWSDEEKYTESKLIDYLCTAKVLVIDDLGVENISKWVNEKLYNIINNRYMNKKVTIFTSNMPIEELNYDSRTTSRIREKTFQIPFPEESVRDIIANRNMQIFTKKVNPGKAHS